VFSSDGVDELVIASQLVSRSAGGSAAASPRNNKDPIAAMKRPVANLMAGTFVDNTASATFPTTGRRQV
jgi:hypothetical protein